MQTGCSYCQAPTLPPPTVPLDYSVSAVVPASSFSVETQPGALEFVHDFWMRVADLVPQNSALSHTMLMLVLILCGTVLTAWAGYVVAAFERPRRFIAVNTAAISVVFYVYCGAIFVAQTLPMVWNSAPALGTSVIAVLLVGTGFLMAVYDTAHRRYVIPASVG